MLWILIRSASVCGLIAVQSCFMDNICKILYLPYLHIVTKQIQMSILKDKKCKGEGFLQPLRPSGQWVKSPSLP